MWIKFTNLIGESNFTTNIDTAIWFTLWRFIECRCMKQTIESDFSAVNQMYTRHGHDPQKWKQRSWTLKYILDVVNNVFPPAKGSKPNDEKFFLSVKKHFDLSNITHFTCWHSNMLAYGFSLRSCEYAETDAYHPPQLIHIGLYYTQRKSRALFYTIPKSKTNQLGIRNETLCATCCCPRLCVLCSMMKYLQWRISVHKLVEEKYKKYLFLVEKVIKIKNPPGSRKKYHFVFGRHNEKLTHLVPLKATVARAVFNKAAEKEYGKNNGHTLHGNRSGGLTDLVMYGLDETAVKGISRHTANSQQLQRYIKFTPEHVAHLVSNAKKLFDCSVLE